MSIVVIEYLDELAGMGAQMLVGLGVGGDASEQHGRKMGGAGAAGLHVPGEVGQRAGHHAGRGLVVSGERCDHVGSPYQM